MGKYKPFREGPLCKVRNYFSKGVRGPEVEVEEDSLLIFFKLVKSGYGSLQEVQQLDARVVLQALNYEKFLKEYEEAYMEMS